MASELIVQTIKGPTTGPNANKIIVPSGQTLTAPGHVMQVVQGTTSTTVSLTSSYADSGLSATITPSSTSNKILVFVNQHWYFNQNGLSVRLLRDSTVVWNPGVNYTYHDGPSNIIGNNRGMATIHYLDSPSTTSAITYKTQAIQHSATAIINADSVPAQITLMEIAG